MKIPPEDFRWYAAFHDEGNHPHVHMMAWSVNPNQAYLSKDGIRQIKSTLTNQIFRQELLHVYEQKSKSRDELVVAARKAMLELAKAMREMTCTLGHYDAGFTLRTYTHATRQKQDEAAQTMGSFMAQVMCSSHTTSSKKHRKLRLSVLFRCKNAENGVSQNAGQLPDPHPDPHWLAVSGFAAYCQLMPHGYNEIRRKT